MDNFDLCLTQIPNRTFARPYVSRPFLSHAQSYNWKWNGGGGRTTP